MAVAHIWGLQRALKLPWLAGKIYDVTRRYEGWQRSHERSSNPDSRFRFHVRNHGPRLQDVKPRSVRSVFHDPESTGRFHVAISSPDYTVPPTLFFSEGLPWTRAGVVAELVGPGSFEVVDVVMSLGPGRYWHHATVSPSCGGPERYYGGAACGNREVDAWNEEGEEHLKCREWNSWATQFSLQHVIKFKFINRQR